MKNKEREPHSFSDLPVVIRDENDENEEKVVHYTCNPPDEKTLGIQRIPTNQHLLKLKCEQFLRDL